MEAKKLPSDYFMEQQVQVIKHRGIKYTRVELLNIAKTPSSGVKMEWNKEIPQEILSAQVGVWGQYYVEYFNWFSHLRNPIKRGRQALDTDVN